MLEVTQIGRRRLLVATLIAAVVLLPLASNAASKHLASPHGLATRAADFADDPSASAQSHAGHCSCAPGQHPSCCDGSDESGDCDFCGLCVVAVPSDIAVVTSPAPSWDSPIHLSGGGLTIPPETKPPTDL